MQVVTPRFTYLAHLAQGVELQILWLPMLAFIQPEQLHFHRQIVDPVDVFESTVLPMSLRKDVSTMTGTMTGWLAAGHGQLTFGYDEYVC